MKIDDGQLARLRRFAAESDGLKRTVLTNAAARYEKALAAEQSVELKANESWTAKILKRLKS